MVQELTLQNTTHTDELVITISDNNLSEILGEIIKTPLTSDPSLVKMASLVRENNQYVL